jgi:dipeptidyl aminopeptidase/acylaminoacyl peptidase
LSCGSAVSPTANLTLVTLKDDAGVKVRDISDLSNPRSLCSLNGQGANYFRFRTATEVSYIVSGTGGAGALYLADLPSKRTSLVRSWTNGAFAAWVYAWSPDGKALSYLSSTVDALTWHLLSVAGDTTVSRLEPAPGRDFNFDTDDAMTGFSADGQYVALEQTASGTDTGAPSAAPAFQVVRLSDAKLVYSQRNATMATWSGSGAHIYFRTLAGVESWDPKAGVQMVVPGLEWIHPWPSADGLRIVYTVADGTGNHLVGYLRLTDQPTTGHVLSDQPRTQAVFLNSTLVWYAEEASCAQTQCGPGGPPLTGKTFLHDLITIGERLSIVVSVFDSWPHVGAA